jgi:hypothetical protein
MPNHGSPSNNATIMKIVDQNNRAPAATCSCLMGHRACRAKVNNGQCPVKGSEAECVGQKPDSA